MSKSTKPTKPVFRPVAKPATQEEKERQAQIYLANEKKNYFQIILASLIQAGKTVQFAVDLAIEGADYAITKLYSVEKKED